MVFIKLLKKVDTANNYIKFEVFLVFLLNSQVYNLSDREKKYKTSLILKESNLKE